MADFATRRIQALEDCEKGQVLYDKIRTIDAQK